LGFGLAPAFYNVGIVIGALYFAPSLGLMGLVLGVLLGAFFHLSIRLIIVRRKKYNFKHKLDFTFSPEIKETIKLTAPKVVQYLMWGFMLLSFTSIASGLAEGSVTVYNYARNFQSIPVSLLGIAIALAMYPTLSHDAGKGNFDKFKRDFRKGRVKSLVYTTLGAIGLAIVIKPVILILFGGGRFSDENALLLAQVIQVYCFAVPLESMMHAYHRAFYSLRNTIIPATLHSIIILATIMFAKNISPTMGVFAIPISFASGLLVQVTILAMVFPWLFKKREKLWVS